MKPIKWEISPEKRTLYKRIYEITWPAFVELVMSTMFGMVDMMMLGQYSASAVAAVGLTNQPNMLLMACFSAINVGATTLIAWGVGAGDTKSARNVTRQTLIVNLALGLVISVLGIWASRPVVVFMAAGGIDEETMETGVRYFQIIAAGLLFQELNMAVTAALRGSGQTRVPMVYNLVANLLNVLGNYIFIYGKLGLPAMGAEGAALSTTLSRAIGCGIALYVVMSRRSMTHIIHVSLKADWRPDWQVIRQMLKIGAPATFEQFILQSGFMLFARTVSTLGTTVFAAHQIGLNINSLAFSPANAFGVAATTLVGQSIGRGETDVAMKQSKVIGHLSMAVNCLVGVLFLLVPQVFARLYTSDAEVIAMTCLCLRMIAVAQPGMSQQLSLAGALRGAGDTLFPMIASVSGVWVFRVIVCYLMVNILGLGLFGAWLTMVMDQYLRAAIIMLRHRSGKWLTYKQRSLERRAQKKAQQA